MNKKLTPQDHFQDITSQEQSFQYQMLGRLQCDLKYYFGYGDRAEKHLWAGNIKDHLELTRLLVEKLKPDWFKEEELKYYEDSV